MGKPTSKLIRFVLATRRMVYFVVESSWGTVPITAIGVVAYYHLYVLVTMLCALFGLVIVIIQITSVIVPRSHGVAPTLLTRVFRVSLSIAIPVVVVTNIRTMDYAWTYVNTWAMESRLLHQVQNDKSRAFRYARFDFGKFAAAKRWVIYDESGQVMLPPQKRNELWWATTKEDKEVEGACFRMARPMFSNFFLGYSACL